MVCTVHLLLLTDIYTATHRLALCTFCFYKFADILLIQVIVRQH